ncbi:uncharacterized protein [Primulina eburnea]|uniref:uncharacterized protein n=1 Tax=Primulina eburnea TaxID=1245227 RepID=UPI003C6C3415
MESGTNMATLKFMNQDMVKLDRFDGTNFTRWQDKLKFLLTAMKIFYILDPNLEEIPAPTDGENKELRAKREKRQEDDLMCRGHILNALSDRLYDLYTNTTSAKEIWQALENKYKAEEEGTKKFLISKYIDFKFLDDKPLLPQVHELQVIVNKMRAVEIELPESFQVGAIIAKLPSTWKSYRKRILHSSENFSLEQIQKHMRIEEESMTRDKNENSYEGTSKANVINQPTKFNNNNKRIGNPFGPKKSIDKLKRKSKGACFVCGKSGHYARDCRFKKKPSDKEAKVNSVEMNNIVATISHVNVVQGKVLGWWYDTCATVHVAYDKSLFKNYQEIEDGQRFKWEMKGVPKLLVKEVQF